ncbi:MAG: PhoU domain-containing protein [Nitrososphaerota archaeon]|nr:PhoU domain-containing protein [Nitrososphaerota archaeon]
MVRLIDSGLEQVRSMLIRMGDLAHEAISTSLKGYIDGVSTYLEVQRTSDILVSTADEVEDRVFELIARFQPVASDLRLLKSYMKISYNIARYGRYALDISQIYEKLDGLGLCEDWIKRHIMEMGEKVLEMIHISIGLLEKYDVEMTRVLSELERHIDEMYFKFLDKLISETSAVNKCIISSVLVVRYLERIADHATYIGESVVYIVTGERVLLR